ncbi:nuclear transcription factor Y subunit alpha-like [Microplitis demolitor]|uniref:nuclear transcription factor Y subunit alpha-like n=1 Tax=Microplitis demolitor TaxID=69319 RepID=UPI00235B6A08|nr:nuclear transcription factor Y subunit alpha-like [Microplitis demolitor]
MKRSDVRRYNPCEKFSSTESLSEDDLSKNKNNKIFTNLETNNPQELNSNSITKNFNSENQNENNKNKLNSNENSNRIRNSNENAKLNKNSKCKVVSNPEPDKSITLPDYSDGSSSSRDMYDAVTLRKKLIKVHPSNLRDESDMTDFGLPYISNNSINSPKHKNSRNLTPSPQSPNPQVESGKTTNTPLSLPPNVQTQATYTHPNPKIQTDKKNVKINKNKFNPSQIKRTTKMAEFTPSPTIRTRRQINKQKNSNDISTESPIKTIPIPPRTPIKPKFVNKKDMGGAIPWSSDEGGDYPKLMDVSAVIHNEPENNINISTNDIGENSFVIEPMTVKPPDETTTIKTNIITQEKIANKNIEKTKTNTTKVNPNLTDADKNRPRGTDAEQTHTNKITPELRRSTRKRKLKTCSCYIMVTLKAIKRQQNLNNKRTNDRLSIINENTSPENSQQTTSRRESQNPTLNSLVDRSSKSPERINSFNDLNFDQQINSADYENFEQIEQINSFNDQNFDQIEQINSSDNEIDTTKFDTIKFGQKSKQIERQCDHSSKRQFI